MTKKKKVKSSCYQKSQKPEKTCNFQKNDKRHIKTPTLSFNIIFIFY